MSDDRVRGEREVRMGADARAGRQGGSTERPRLLLLVATRSYRAGAFLAAARRLGARVTVGTERAQALSQLHPEGNLTLDFSRPGVACEAILAFAKQHPIDAVIAADDDGAVLAASAAQALGLRANPVDAVKTALSKRRTREAMRAHRLPCPAFQWIEATEDATEFARRVAFPCVVKAPALSASRGVIRADDATEFVAAVERVRAIVRDAMGPDAAAGVLIEDYLPGREFAIEGLLERGVLRVLAIFEKPDPLEGPFFEETLYLTPPRLEARSIRAIETHVADLARAVGLGEGPVHAEVRLHQGIVWPLEIAPRSIGGLCSRALRFDPDLSLEALILAWALGRPEASAPRKARAAGVMMIPIVRGGTVRGTSGIEAATAVPGIDDIRIMATPGERLVPLPEGSRYLGFIFARAERTDEVERALREAHGKLTFDIEGD